MQVWLKAFGIFGLVVAAPFLMERLLSRNAKLPGASSFKGIPWDDVIIFGGSGLIVLVIAAVFVWFGRLVFVQAYEISDYLTLAEREMNGLLRGWGGGLPTDARKKMAEERASWLAMIPKDSAEAVAEVYKAFYEQNQKELGGGPQADSMGRARLTAFLLREVYEGNIALAQLKIINEFKNSGKLPFVVSGLRQLLELDSFDEKEARFKKAGVGWFTLTVAVKLHRHPRHILMVKPDKTVVENWDVIDELNRQAKPSS